MPDGGWSDFDTALVPLEWGRNVYTVPVVPRDLEDEAKEQGTRRLEGDVDDEPVNVGIARADVTPDAFFHVGPALRRRLGVRAGAVVHCRSRPVDSDVVPLPDDVRAARVASLVRDL